MKTNGKIQLYPLVRVAVMLISGMLVADAIGESFQPLVWLVITIILVLLSIIVRSPNSQSLFVLCLSFSIGATWMSRSLHQQNVSIPDYPVTYDAVVTSHPVVKGKVVRCDLLTISGKRPLKISASFIRNPFSESIRTGDGILITSVLEDIYGKTGTRPNMVRYMKTHGYQAQTLVLPDEWVRTSVDLHELSWMERARLAALMVRDQLIEQLKGKGFIDQDLAVVTAMSLGDKTMINKEIRESYSISGVSHVLALSGMHLGIIYLVLSMTVARWRRCRGLLRPVSEGVILLAIWMYVFLVGMSPSVVRSAVMITVFSLMSLLHRGKMSLNVLGFTAIVMLLSNPMNLFDVGFQMSFIAVASILLFSHRIFVCLPTVRHRLLRWLWGLLSVSLAAQIGVAPLTAYYFGQVSCYFLFTNIIIVMLTTLIIYLSLAFFIFLWLTPVASLLAQLLSVVAHVQNTVVQWISTCPGSVISNIHLHVVQVLLIYVIILCVYAMICRLDLYKHEKMITFAP